MQQRRQKTNSIAIGTGARSDKQNATAIGAGSVAKSALGGSESSVTLGREGDGTTDYFLPGLANKPGEDGSNQSGGTQYLTVDSEGKIIAAIAEVPPEVEIIAPNFNCTATGNGAHLFWQRCTGHW